MRPGLDVARVVDGGGGQLEFTRGVGGGGGGGGGGGEDGFPFGEVGPERAGGRAADIDALDDARVRGRPAHDHLAPVVGSGRGDDGGRGEVVRRRQRRGEGRA